jgi:hypothetical protein
METPKKYHDLVLLDESGETNQLNIIKSISIVFLFIVGIAIGAIFISLLYQENYAITQAIFRTAPPIDNINASSTQDIAPMELQSITGDAIIASPKTSGCSIESLGRNMSDQGCFVNDYKDVAVEDAADSVPAGVTELDNLSPAVEGLIKIDVPQDTGSVTNILDLQ